MDTKYLVMCRREPELGDETTGTSRLYRLLARSSQVEDMALCLFEFLLQIIA